MSLLGLKGLRVATTVAVYEIVCHLQELVSLMQIAKQCYIDCYMLCERKKVTF